MTCKKIRLLGPIFFVPIRQIENEKTEADLELLQHPRWSTLSSILDVAAVLDPSLKTKVLDGKALRLSASCCQQQILHLYVIPPCKWSYKKEVTLRLKASYVHCKSSIITTVYLTGEINIYDMIWYDKALIRGTYSDLIIVNDEALIRTWLLCQT